MTTYTLVQYDSKSQTGAEIGEVALVFEAPDNQRAIEVIRAQFDPPFKRFELYHAIAAHRNEYIDIHETL